MVITTKVTMEHVYYVDWKDITTCIHYGFETFIVPSTSQNQQILIAPSSIDHVIFDKDNYKDQYPGESFNTILMKIFPTYCILIMVTCQVWISRN